MDWTVYWFMLPVCVVVAGALLGTRLHGRVREDVARRFFAGLFLLIGLTFLLAFSPFARRFA